MTRVAIEIDEEVLARVERLARARQTSVEELLRKQTEELVRLAPIEIHNPSHRKILEALQRSADDSSSPRDEIYDRDKARAEGYLANRRRLLDLIDHTQGDMGVQPWNRARLYER